MRALLLAAGSCTKPDAKAFATLQEPIAKEVTAVMQVPEKNRKERVWYNHLMVISEGIPSVGWVGVVSTLRGDLGKTRYLFGPSFT